MNELELKNSYWASVSGGKDSLLMLKLILENPDKYPLDGVVHFELEIDYPFIKEVVDYMEKECVRKGIKFYRIKPRKSYYELYNKYGFPTRTVRWCNSQYKLDSLKQLEEFMKNQGYKVINYIGYCVDEFKRYDKRKSPNEIYPLVDMGIEESKVLAWAKTVPLFNNYYKTNLRCGCMFCPMASYLNLAYLYKYYPDNFNTMMTMTKKTEELRAKELGRPFSVFQSNPKYNTEYVVKRVKEKYLPILEEKEREQNESNRLQSND